ncbi:hypothetical protein JHK85_027266 [Glycine max]|nr:hypothetical protein JHK85_027266 [Glycine max]
MHGFNHAKLERLFASTCFTKGHLCLPLEQQVHDDFMLFGLEVSMLLPSTTSFFLSGKKGKVVVDRVWEEIDGRYRIAANLLLLELNNNKEVIYGALDDWVAWEKNFPIIVENNINLS